MSEMEALEMQSIDVAVVGGGVAGLIAAHDTARMGLGTVLFEATPDVGGRAQTRVQSGFHFNQGPHALYTRGRFRQTLEALAIDVSGANPRLNEGIALWDDHQHPLPLDVETMRRATPFDQLDREELIATVGQLTREANDYRGQPLATVTDRFRPRVASWVQALIRLVTYVHAPDELDASAALNQLRLASGGVLYIDDGWGALTAALGKSAAAAGAAIRLESRVARIARQGSTWLVSGPGLEDCAASAVVLAVGPQEAATLVEGSRDLAAAHRHAKPVRLVCLDLGLSKLPRPEATFALGVDQPVYFSVHSDVARLAPSLGAMVHAARYLEPGEAPTPSHFDDLERLVDWLQPGWRPLEVHRQRLAGIVVAHDLPSFRARSPRRSVVADSPGLFPAGDWIGGNGMLSDASAASAQDAARSVGDYLRCAA